MAVQDRLWAASGVGVAKAVVANNHSMVGFPTPTQATPHTFGIALAKVAIRSCQTHALEGSTTTAIVHAMATTLVVHSSAKAAVVCNGVTAAPKARTKRTPTAGRGIAVALRQGKKELEPIAIGEAA